MKKAIGYAMLALLAVGLFSFLGFLCGFWLAFGAFALAIFISGWLSVAVWLVASTGEAAKEKRNDR